MPQVVNMKNFARKWLVPPGINQMLINAPPPLKRMWGWKPKPRGPEAIFLDPLGKTAASLDELKVAPFWKVVWVETQKLRRGALAFTFQQHPHVRYFTDGLESLQRFYELHQPRNQMEALMIDCSTKTDFIPVVPPRFRHPWGFEETHSAELDLDLSHGIQFHGPVSDQKLFLESRRLDRVRDSVQEQGFFRFDNGPDFICFGDLLVRDVKGEECDYRLSVENGLHRTSYLAHLGWNLIPMMPHPVWRSREVRLSECARWPGVLDGTFSEDAARAYFLAYFRSPTEELLPGW